ncbi:hypothetical protein JOE11_005306 [Robbsia andropogonis]
MTTNPVIESATDDEAWRAELLDGIPFLRHLGARLL